MKHLLIKWLKGIVERGVWSLRQLSMKKPPLWSILSAFDTLIKSYLWQCEGSSFAGEVDTKHFVVVIWEQEYWRDQQPVLLPPGRGHSSTAMQRARSIGTDPGWSKDHFPQWNSSGLQNCSPAWSSMWSCASHSVTLHFWSPSRLLPLFLTFELRRVAVIPQSVHSVPSRGVWYSSMGQWSPHHWENGDLGVEKWKKLRAYWKNWFLLCPSYLTWTVFNEMSVRKKEDILFWGVRKVTVPCAVLS